MPRVDRLQLVHGALALFALALVGRAAKVQLLDTESWRARARQQQVSAAPLPAIRGEVRDAGDELLVESRALVRLALAPKEVLGPPPRAGRPRSANSVRRLVTLREGLRRLEVPEPVIAKATDTTRKWVEVPGSFLPTEAAAVAALPGVQVTPVLERVPPGSEGLRRLVGRTGPDHRAVDGVELALDDLLHGQAGRAAQVRDGRGGRYDSPEASVTAPTPGHTVQLTINRGLQEIAERALADAVQRAGARGGDVVVLDPNSGEVRAMASRRADPRSTAATALTEPFEPGSTLKPFVAAALLDRGRVRLDEQVPVYGGKWTVEGRTITDVHRADRLTLADVIRHSSNIGIVQFAARLSAREHYELYRDLGFGAPTGVPYPSESPGLLMPPARWSRQSRASLAMGYELMVTPLQLATAYAAIANGGRLVQPALVREIRAADGTVVYRHQPRVVRRVLSERGAAEARRMLQAVVDSGTATDAGLRTYDVGGKSGTARRTAGGKGYAAGSYTATFVGIFPVERPQYVVLVKLDDPSGAYYGGKIAAPVMRTVLEGALASRDPALDRARLAEAEHAPNRAPAPPPVTDVAAAPPRDPATVPYVWTVAGSRASTTASVPAMLPRRPVPDVDGLPTRRAVRELHRAGFRVTLVRGAPAQDPPAGTLAPAGALVRVGGGR